MRRSPRHSPAVSRGRAALLGAAALLAAVLALGGTGPAGAGSAGERIVEYDIDIAIGVDGGVRFEERIVYDFGRNQAHGIFRDVVTRQHHDDRHDRVYPFELEGVEGSPGTPVDVEVDRTGSRARIRIGDPDQTISGRHTYVVRYRLERVLNGFPSHDELFWNAVGLGWEVPIESVRVQVATPADIVEATCFAGPVGSTRSCSGVSVEGARASFTHEAVGPGEAVTPVVAIPSGVLPAPSPLLDERETVVSLVGFTPFKTTAAGVLLLVVTVAMGWFLWTRGRDEQHAGSAISAAFGDGTGSTRRVPLGGGATEIPVEFEPPDGLRPGQVGTLVDEVAHPLDVSATIVDLAVRGYLRIEEVDGRGWFAKDDWQLVQLREPDSSLHHYERKLLASLFRRASPVLVSDLKTEFHRDLASVQELLYKDAVQQGWFAGRPDRLRQRVAAVGAAVAIAGFVLCGLAILNTSWGLLVTPIPWAGILLVVASRWMPRRTARGTAALRRAMGFRRFIAESERERAQFAERAHLFTEYLPYAVVFGETEKWARAFDGLADEPGDWYVGRRGLTPVHLASTLGDFSVRTAGTLSATPGSSGSSGFGGGGFSGGGGGGGGGGSW